nr:response regulator [Moritella viscosa]
MNTFIAEILEKDSFDNFSISQLKDAYVSLSTDTSPVESRKFVYKQILRLIKLGGLMKDGDKNSRSATYRKTNLFNKIVFIKKNRLIQSDKTLSPENPLKKKKISIHELEEKLHKYKIDMISTVGESEEYIELAKSFPDMKVPLKEKHHLARDKSYKLIGQIEAVKMLIRLQASL